MKIKPLYSNVLIKPKAKNETTKSGIVLPDSVEEKGPKEGEVVALGEGKLLENGKRQAMSVKVGDKVMFEKGFSSHQIKIDEEEYIIVKEDDILAIL